MVGAKVTQLVGLLLAACCLLSAVSTAPLLGTNTATKPAPSGHASTLPSLVTPGHPAAVAASSVSATVHLSMSTSTATPALTSTLTSTETSTVTSTETSTLTSTETSRQPIVVSHRSISGRDVASSMEDLSDAESSGDEAAAKEAAKEASKEASNEPLRETSEEASKETSEEASKEPLREAIVKALKDAERRIESKLATGGQSSVGLVALVLGEVAKRGEQSPATLRAQEALLSETEEERAHDELEVTKSDTSLIYSLKALLCFGSLQYTHCPHKTRTN